MITVRMILALMDEEELVNVLCDYRAWSSLDEGCRTACEVVEKCDGCLDYPVEYIFRSVNDRIVIGFREEEN